jgi:alkylation response protein AidB-like acyl-CoA dehydrogenase
MIDFSPSDEQQMMREAVGQFARSTLASRVREFEAMRGLPEDVRRTAHEMGLGGVALPAACGGQELGLTTRVLLEEEIAKFDPAAAFALPGPGAFGDALMELCPDPRFAASLLSPFFDAGAHDAYGAVAWSEPGPCRERPGLSTVARREGDGWRIRGKKAYVHQAGLADRFVVFAQVSPERGWDGLGAFVVMADAPGLSIGERHDTLGLDAAWFGALTLTDAPAHARLEPAGDFTRALLRFFARHALVVGARAVGLAQSAFDLAREYCDTRVAFGKPIGHFQAVAFNLADRLMDVESARWMVWRAAWLHDATRPERELLRDTAHAVAHALEVAMRSADDCVGLHGGMGFMRDVAAEKTMRDAKQMAVSCLTSEHLDQLAAAMALDAPLDAALLLPTSEAQPIFV